MNYVSNKDATVYADGTKTAPCENSCGTVHTTIDEGSMLKTVATIGEKKYATLAEAVADAQNDETVTLVMDASGAGMVIDKSITIDFGGNTYSVTEPVGSTGTASNGLQILQGNTVVLQNGTLNVAQSEAAEFYILIQNYANLTVTDMTLDGTNLDKYAKTDGDSYTLSNNCGTVLINGETNVIANNEGALAVAIDACKYQTYAEPVVTIDTTGTVSGTVEVTGGTLTAENGTFNVENTECLDVFVCASGKLTINNGSVTGGDANGSTAVFAKENATVYINGGTFFVGGDDTAEQGYNDLIYARDNAVIYVSGGEFDGPSRDSDGTKFLLNLKDYSNAKIVVTGGTFKGFNPGDTGTEPDGKADDFCAEGYGPTDIGNNTYGVHMHNYQAEVTAPTCTAAGYTTHTCSVCNHSYTDSTVDALGHTPGAEAGCLNAQVCTVCGTELNPSLGHAYGAEQRYEASEKSDAWYGRICSRCEHQDIIRWEHGTQLNAALVVETGFVGSLNDAVEKATANQTIQLLKNVSWYGLLEDEKLDLNGYTLTVVKYMIAFNGASVVDNSAENTGRLVLAEGLGKDRLILPATNEQMPIKVENGYMFVVLRGINYAKMSSKKVVFQPLFETTAFKPLLDGTESCDIEIGVRVSWTKGDYRKTQDFVFNDSLVSVVINSYDPASRKFEKMCTLEMSSDAYQYSFEVFVRSGTRVERVQNQRYIEQVD